VKAAGAVVLSVCLEKLSKIRDELLKMERLQWDEMLKEGVESESIDFVTGGTNDEEEKEGGGGGSGSVGGGLRKGWAKGVFRELKEEIKRRVPDVQVVLAFQGSIGKTNTGTSSAAGASGQSTPSSKKNKQQKQSQPKQEGDENMGSLMEIDDSQIQTGINFTETDREEDPDLTTEVLQSTALRLFRLYQIHFPDLVLESGFDHGKLVPAEFVVVGLPGGERKIAKATNVDAKDGEDEGGKGEDEKDEEDEKQENDESKKVKEEEAVMEAQKQLLELLLEVPEFKWWNHAGKCLLFHSVVLFSSRITT
jgi:hypothetical protein